MMNKLKRLLPGLVASCIQYTNVMINYYIATIYCVMYTNTAMSSRVSQM